MLPKLDFVTKGCIEKNLGWIMIIVDTNFYIVVILSQIEF